MQFSPRSYGCPPVFTDSLYLLGGYVHVEMPISLSRYQQSVQQMCGVVHKVLVGEFFGEMNHTLVQDALKALDGDC